MLRVMRKLIVLVIACLALPSSLSARIVPDQCIDGVGLLDTSEQVLAQWGTPLRKERRFSYQSWWRYKGRSVLLERWYRPRPKVWYVLVVVTTDRSQRTPAGVGPGSSHAQVRRAYPREGCPRSGSCEIGRSNARFTTLHLKAGRVVDVALSADSSYDDGGLPPPEL
jgi:hypothetical protein